MLKETGFRAAVRREWQRMMSRPIYLLFTVVFPVAVFLFLWVLFYTGTPRNLPVIVCDQDGSALSHRFIRMLGSAPSVRIVHHVSDMEEGRKMLLRREAYALVLVPRNLERDALRKKSPRMVCYYNMQLLTPGSLISQDFRKTVDALAAELARGRGGAVRNAGQGEAIALDMHALFNPVMNYRYFLACTLLPAMLQIFVIMISAFSAGLEFREGTAGRWLQTAGDSTWKALAGKLLPYTLIFAVTGLLMQAVMFAFLEVPLRGSFLFLSLATALLIAAYQCLGFLFVAVTYNLRLSLSFAAFYSVPAFAFSGVNFPVEAMSFFGKLWSCVLPYTYYGKILIDQSVRGASIATSVPSLIILGLFVLLLPLPIVWRFGKLMRDERYWRRP